MLGYLSRFTVQMQMADSVGMMEKPLNDCLCTWLDMAALDLGYWLGIMGVGVGSKVANASPNLLRNWRPGPTIKIESTHDGSN